MIKDILDNLHLVDAETENLKIAKGKYKLPTTTKEALKVLKNKLYD